ncbi:unnamed protein product [Bursaphelenchus okinawaensis]|uniref:Peroxidase n=1 Tax=Bursaphelenchus okinawaensis TaxID=465554 RepID=A0A811K8D8_9BILA|nr:unnamed protein product [Bursaphelenchus okinawaensis]CAG9095532.1 unnamed protein product [Bursaphelenchus okinawaensis]
MWVLLLIGTLFLHLHASQIPCGKASFPCEGVVLQPQQPVRVYGVSNVNPGVQRPKLPESMIRTVAQEAQTEVERILDESSAKPINSRSSMSAAMSSFVKMHSVNHLTKAQSIPAYISDSMTKKFLRLGLRESDVFEGLDETLLQSTYFGRTCHQVKNETCPPTFYRSYNGRCNNVQHSEWGVASGPYQRLSPAAYADSTSAPRDSKTGKGLPNERLVSLEVFKEPNQPHEGLTHLVPYWMYIMASDMGESAPNQLILNGESNPLPCCSPDIKHPDCVSIPIFQNDPIYNASGVNCMPLARTLPAQPNECKLGHREQSNQASSYLDLSFLYGNSKEEAAKLRASGGRLLSSGPIDLPPPDKSFATFCRSHLNNNCFLSGSRDVNLLPGITGLHAIWHRQHNFIANNLRRINPRWNDDRVFEETRKITIAQFQHITYTEFLPLVLGQEAMNHYQLSPMPNGFASDYDMSLNGATLNEFAVLATNLALVWLNKHKVELMASFNNPDVFYQRNGFERVVYELITANMEHTGPKMSEAFRGRFLSVSPSQPGLDLVAMALKQSREHGVPGYATIRRQCGFGRIYTFNDLRNDILSFELLQRMSDVYDSVDDIDLLVGVLAEKPKKGALVGPTLTCILGTQFYKTKKGDRFWYENFFSTSSFNDDQLIQIRETTLASVLCAVGGQQQLQPSVFMKSDQYENAFVKCDSKTINKLDFMAWKDDDSTIELPVTKETLMKVIELAKFNIQERDRRETLNVQRNQRPFQKGDPLFAYSNMMRPKTETKIFSKVADVLLESTKILTEGRTLPDGEVLPKLSNDVLVKLLPDVGIESLFNNFTAFLSENGRATLEECLPRQLPCDHTSRYRTYSGWCNNLKHPEFANAFTPLQHLLKPSYEDGFDAPRSRAKSGKALPSPRVISNTVHADVNVSHTRFTHMVMQFGQFVDHELTHSPVARAANDEILNCTRCDSATTISKHCMPLRVEPGDPHFPTVMENGEPRCLPFARSLLGQVNLGYRAQINQLTAFIDGSAIYGSTTCESNNLRLFSGGLMNFTNLGVGNHMALPQGEQEKDCRSSPREQCFVAGDERNSHQPGLTMMHTFFLREHNRIAKQLSKINPHWNDERIFQETRRIHVAQLQHIVFSEFLPKIIGNELLSEYDLVPLKNGYYIGYDDTCNAAISQPFATAAYRFGHTLVRKLFPRMDPNYKEMAEPVDLSQHFGHVGPIYNQSAGGMDSMLMGLLGTPAMAFDRHITSALRNHLFARRGLDKSGMDLIAINMLRARDHGVQPYNEYRQLCGFKKAKSFEDLLDLMDSSAVNALKAVYEDVDDIDLFPGLTSERPKFGALLGPTMSCILAEQFRRLKKCDRFYYENDNQAARFIPPQLQEIRKVKLATIFCQNSEYLKFLQPNVFDLPDNMMNAHLSCNEFETIDLSLWKETPECEINGLKIQLGESRRITPCMSCICTSEGTECAPVRVKNCDKLFQQYDVNDIKKDASCITQCAELLSSVDSKAS